MIAWRRLLREDVERRARNPLLFDRADERLLVDERASRGVDEIRGGFHRAELGFADQSKRLWCRRRVERDVVSRPEKLLQGSGRSYVGRKIFCSQAGCVCKHVEPEALCLGNDRAGDSTKTDETERLPSQSR